MRVLLINPWQPEIFPPPAIGYLQSALKHWKIDVRAMDLEEALATKEEFDLVGVSFHSFSVKYARQIRDKFKCRLICGGHHSTALPEQMLSVGYDQVVLGEGENAIIAIIEGVKDKIINSIDFENRYFFGINELPFPDYSGIHFGGEQGISIITSRGCPFRCNFCASTEFWSYKYRMRSAQNVLLEVNKRISEGWRSWIFEDDNFTANRSRALEICEGLNGQFTWTCTSRAEILDIDFCKELYRAGCRGVWLGIESFSQASLERMNKRTSVLDMLKGIANAESVGIRAICLFLVGYPGETLNDIEITHQIIRQSKIKEYGKNIAWILPNTEIYWKAKERGFDDSVYLESGAPFYTYEHSIEELTKWSNHL